jgi:hypothetical protein
MQWKSLNYWTNPIAGNATKKPAWRLQVLFIKAGAGSKNARIWTSPLSRATAAKRPRRASFRKMRRRSPAFRIKAIDLSAAADRLGGDYRNGKLTLKILGKPLSVDSNGHFFTDIHVHRWVAVPVLNYILCGEGRPVSGKWVPFRELDGGKSWYRLFGQRCEKPIKKVADTYTDLFDDMVHLFGGSQVESAYDSDIAVVLYALPKIPILICYWRPAEGLESELHLFFDATAESNLGIESLFTLGAGLALMFEKLAQRHG